MYENVAGMDAAVRYLEELGNRTNESKSNSRRVALQKALSAIRAYEQSLSLEMLDVLQRCGATVYGITDPHQFEKRVPTFCFNLPKIPPAGVTEQFARQGIGVRDGHMYAPRLMKRLGLSPESGAVRASLVHYNTHDEVQQFHEVLAGMTRSC